MCLEEEHRVSEVQLPEVYVQIGTILMKTAARKRVWLNFHVGRVHRIRAVGCADCVGDDDD